MGITLSEGATCLIEGRPNNILWSLPPIQSLTVIPIWPTDQLGLNTARKAFGDNLFRELIAGLLLN